MDGIYGGKSKCTFCGEEISYDSRRCPYCGSLLETRAPSFKPDIPVSEGYKMEGSKNILENTTLVQDSKFDSVMETASSQKEVPQIKADYSSGNEMRNSGFAAEIPRTGMDRHRLSNGMKVFLTALCTVIPGLGQLIGIIAGIIFMNAEGDEDRKSFGLALLIASLIFFVLSSIFSFVLIIGLFA